MNRIKSAANTIALTDAQKKCLISAIKNGKPVNPQPVVRAKVVFAIVSAMAFLLICVLGIVGQIKDDYIVWVEAKNTAEYLSIINAFGMDGYKGVDKSYVVMADGVGIGVKGSGKINGGILTAYAAYDDSDVIAKSVGGIYTGIRYTETMNVNGIEIQCAVIKEADEYFYCYSYTVDNVEHFDMIRSEQGDKLNFYLELMFD